MQCELCGFEEKLYRVKIEGTELKVCRSCALHGVILGAVEEPAAKEKPKPAAQKSAAEEPIEIIVLGFSKKIKNKRESLGLSQKDFAKMISEKESVVHKLESSELTPSIELAKKIEKLLNIRLIEKYAESMRAASKKAAGEEVTIGDFIRIRKRKK